MTPPLHSRTTQFRETSKFSGSPLPESISPSNRSGLIYLCIKCKLKFSLIRFCPKSGENCPPFISSLQFTSFILPLSALKFQSPLKNSFFILVPIILTFVILTISRSLFPGRTSSPSLISDNNTREFIPTDLTLTVLRDQAQLCLNFAGSELSCPNPTQPVLLGTLLPQCHHHVPQFYVLPINVSLQPTLRQLPEQEILFSFPQVTDRRAKAVFTLVLPPMPATFQFLKDLIPDPQSLVPSHSFPNRPQNQVLAFSYFIPTLPHAIQKILSQQLKLQVISVPKHYNPSLTTQRSQRPSSLKFIFEPIPSIFLFCSNPPVWTKEAALCFLDASTSSNAQVCHPSQLPVFQSSFGSPEHQISSIKWNQDLPVSSASKSLDFAPKFQICLDDNTERSVPAKFPFSLHFQNSNNYTVELQQLSHRRTKKISLSTSPSSSFRTNFGFLPPPSLPFKSPTKDLRTKNFLSKSSPRSTWLATSPLLQKLFSVPDMCGISARRQNPCVGFSEFTHIGPCNLLLASLPSLTISSFTKSILIAKAPGSQGADAE